jgi:hypothetical protein
MDDIDKLKELRLIQQLSLKNNSLEQANQSEFGDDELIKVKDIISQLISNVDESPYFFIEQWSPFGFVIHYRFHYKKRNIFDVSEHYLPNGYDRYVMDKLILGEINSSKYTYFLGKHPRKLSDIDY